MQKKKTNGKITFGKHHSSSVLQTRDPKMDAKIKERKVEEKEKICIVSNYLPTRH